MASQNDTLAPPEEDPGYVSSDWEDSDEATRKDPPEHRSVVIPGMKAKIPNPKKFEKGKKVSLRSRGKTVEYTIIKVHSDGTYDLKNALGEEKKKVDQSKFIE